MQQTPCPACGNREALPDALALADILPALSIDDLDAAIEAGLLQWPGCVACNVQAGLPADAVTILLSARDARLAALAARERYRARQVRLQHRAAALDAKRSPPRAIVDDTAGALPSAAAAALARAKAKAAGRTPR